VSTYGTPYRRRRVRIVFIPVGLIVAGVIALVHALSGPPGPVSGDFRDPSVLARAISAAVQEKGDGSVISSYCVQTTFPDYACSIAFVGGNVATYNVVVATDGSSWQTT
jgi:hypothetical protein